jgi:hypothetical protein
MANRTRPYTDAGLSRVPCAHCGEPSTAEWMLRPCAIGQKRYYGLCRVHDIELNRLTVNFLRVPDADALMERYEASR